MTSGDVIMEETQKSKDVWFCDNCKKEFETKEETLEHERTCQDTVGSLKRKNELHKRMERKRMELEFQELLKKDRMKNPTLARISDHLYWLAFIAKLGLISMLISFSLLIMAAADFN